MTLQEMATSLATKRETVKSILGKTDASTDELTRADALISEIGRDEAEYQSAVKRAEFASSNETALKALTQQPVTAMVHPNGGQMEPQTALKAVTEPVYRRVSGLKSFKTEKEAYRFGSWFLAEVVAQGRPSTKAFARAIEYCENNGLKAQSELTNIDGGALVPTEFDTTLIDLREQYGVFRRYTKVVPMASDTKSVPRRVSGLTPYFVTDNTAITESQKGWDTVNLVAKKLAVLAKYSSEVAEDAIINMGDDLAGEIAYAFANKEDECGFNGDGTSTYGGITGIREKLLGLHGTIAYISGLVVGAGNTYAELTLANFNSVVAKLPQYADTPGASWFCHRSFYYETMERLALAQGGVTAMEVSQGATRGRPLFLGYPVVFTQVMPKVEGNSQICLLLGDISLGCRMGDRRQNTIALDSSVGFASDQWTIRGTERFDIVVHDVGNAHATAASQVQGPIVGLITASS